MELSEEDYNKTTTLHDYWASIAKKATNPLHKAQAQSKANGFKMTLKSAHKARYARTNGS